MNDSKRLFSVADIHAAAPEAIATDPDTAMYVRAISGVDSDAHNIRRPNISGAISPVFIADTGSGTYVYKFRAKELAIRNSIISYTLQDLNIPVPLISKHNFQDIWFERYEYCPDNTLFEAIADGMSKEQVFNVLKQALYYQGRIKQLPKKIFQPLYCRHYDQIFAETLKGKYPDVIFPSYVAVVFCLTRIGRQYVCHNDINPKNILVDKNGNLSRLLDMDSVALNNEIFSMVSSLLHYPQYTHEEIIRFYEFTCGHKINKRLISAIFELIKCSRGIRHKVEDAIKPGLNPYR